MKPERIIDSHQHVFWHSRDDRGLVADLDEHEIDKAWLLSWEIPPFEDAPTVHHLLNPLHFRSDGTHAGIPLSDLVLAKHRHPDRFVLGYCPHPAFPSAPALLRAAARIHGVQVCGEWKFRIPFDDPRSLELFYVAGELGLPVVLHLDVPYLYENGRKQYQSCWYGGTVHNLDRALEACPDTTFIGHAPGFWRELGAHSDSDSRMLPDGPIEEEGRLQQLFRSRPNLMADLSAGSGLNALKRDPAYSEQFLSRFSDRLLFGRDCYGGDLQAFLRTLNLGQEVIDKIFFKNAERLLCKSQG